MASYNVCSVLRCLNPVPVTVESRHCGKHGGETQPMWSVYHDEHGWLIDTGVGGSYSFDVSDAQWFESTTDAIDTLKACDLLEASQDADRATVWARVGLFLIVLVK